MRSLSKKIKRFQKNQVNFKNMETQNIPYPDLKIIKELFYDQCDFKFINLELNSASTEYSACSFNLNGYKIEYRLSKITPTKTGQFVTIWKRGKNGKTEPFDVTDDFDFIIISSIVGNRIGQFIFSKSVLVNKRIITQEGKYGKRGIRVYSIWDFTTNIQAEKTKNWQTKYFIEIKNGDSTNINFVKKTLTKLMEK